MDLRLRVHVRRVLLESRAFRRRIMSGLIPGSGGKRKKTAYGYASAELSPIYQNRVRNYGDISRQKSLRKIESEVSSYSGD
jgi:hypothetical protein